MRLRRAVAIEVTGLDVQRVHELLAVIARLQVRELRTGKELVLRLDERRQLWTARADLSGNGRHFEQAWSHERALLDRVFRRRPFSARPKDRTYPLDVTAALAERPEDSADIARAFGVLAAACRADLPEQERQLLVDDVVVVPHAWDRRGDPRVAGAVQSDRVRSVAAQARISGVPEVVVHDYARCFDSLDVERYEAWRAQQHALDGYVRRRCQESAGQRFDLQDLLGRFAHFLVQEVPGTVGADVEERDVDEELFGIPSWRIVSPVKYEERRTLLLLEDLRPGRILLHDFDEIAMWSTRTTFDKALRRLLHGNEDPGPRRSTCACGATSREPCPLDGSGVWQRCGRATTVGADDPAAQVASLGPSIADEVVALLDAAGTVPGDALASVVRSICIRLDEPGGLAGDELRRMSPGLDAARRFWPSSVEEPWSSSLLEAARRVLLHPAPGGTLAERLRRAMGDVWPRSWGYAAPAALAVEDRRKWENAAAKRRERALPLVAHFVCVLLAELPVVDVEEQDAVDALALSALRVRLSLLLLQRLLPTHAALSGDSARERATAERAGALATHVVAGLSEQLAEADLSRVRGLMAADLSDDALAATWRALHGKHVALPVCALIGQALLQPGIRLALGLVPWPDAVAPDGGGATRSPGPGLPEGPRPVEPAEWPLAPEDLRPLCSRLADALDRQGHGAAQTYRDAAVAPDLATLMAVLRRALRTVDGRGGGST